MGRADVPPVLSGHDRDGHGTHGRDARATLGATLVELLTVVAILAVLSAVVWVAVAGRVKGAAKQTQIKSDMRQVIAAINLYRSDNDSGLPSSWQNFGYYAVNRKGCFGDGYPLEDVRYDTPPEYDVSYHTPECARSPKAAMGFGMFRQMVAQFEARPRINRIDVEHDQALRFEHVCLASSRGERPVRVMRIGEVVTYQLGDVRSLGADLSGTLSYAWLPDWHHETTLGY